MAAGVLLVLAVIHFAERGFLLNNAYIYASLKERENMDKKPQKILFEAMKVDLHNFVPVYKDYDQAYEDILKFLSGIVK